MSSAKGLARRYSPYEVGTGRLDVAAAVTQHRQRHGLAVLRQLHWPHEPTDAAVTKDRHVHQPRCRRRHAEPGDGRDGPVHAGRQYGHRAGRRQRRASRSPATRPPPRPAAARLRRGHRRGHRQPVTRTSLGLVKEDERYDLTIKLVDRDGNPATSKRVVVNQAGSTVGRTSIRRGRATLRLPPGTYTVLTYLDVAGEDGGLAPASP